MGLPFLSTLVESVVKEADELFTSDEEREKIKLALTKELNRSHHLQSVANIESSNHSSIFVAGARPFVMWICGFAFAYATLIEPIARFIATMAGYTGTFPELDTALTLQVLLGMMGLGAMRSFDKVKHVDTKKVK